MKFCKPLYFAVFSIILLIANSTHAQKPLSAKEASRLSDAALNEETALQLPKAALAWKSKKLTSGIYTMKFDYKIFGKRPVDGRSLFISMHGGGNVRKEENDSQWRNQIELYRPEEGVYIVPRSPTDSWNMWHQGHIDTLFAEMIKDAVIMEGVNINKVYIMGYSAGGDGVYQLAPRMADFWAAAAMMAGHPGDAAIDNLRNLPFTLFAGGKDAAYDRNKLALDWGRRMDSMAAADSGAYVHDIHVYPEMSHWMQHQDTIAVPWMAKYKRNALPKKVIWVQDDIVHEQFYWLGIPKGTGKAGTITEVSVSGNTITIDQNDNDILYLYVNDLVLNLDKNVVLINKGRRIFKGKIPRNANVIKETSRRMDKDLIFSARIVLKNDKVELH